MGGGFCLLLAPNFATFHGIARSVLGYRRCGKRKPHFFLVLLSPPLFWILNLSFFFSVCFDFLFIFCCCCRREKRRGKRRMGVKVGVPCSDAFILEISRNKKHLGECV